MFVEMGLLSEALAQAVIPLAALVGICFALFQWFLVSKVKVSNEDGYSESLIENEEEGVDDFDAVVRCSDIQNAISVGELSPRCSFVCSAEGWPLCSCNVLPYLLADERGLII